MCKKLKKIDHVVVLMMENRSFDNMAGWLYAKGNKPPFDKVPRGQAFDGVAGKQLSNPIPKEAQDSWRRVVPVGRGSHDLDPTTDPGEVYRQVNTQVYGGREPMKGFVQDYIGMLGKDGKPTSYASYKKIMNGFTPDQVPVLSALANQYAVCDSWFCSVPSQTWANRSFFHAGTSAGLVDNWPYINWLKNDTATIFNRMSDAGLSWGVYYDAQTIVSLTMLIHFKQLAKHWNANFHFMQKFYKDAEEGTLPNYTFIEPCFNNWRGKRSDQHPPYSVAEGERLIYDVYQALRKGKNWRRTLFVITYDEHGGCYDHVLPPATTPPDPGAPAGQEGFRFDRLGVRVCTVLVSPYIEQGTVFRPKDKSGNEVPLEHGSMIRTLRKRWKLPALTERDRHAMDFEQVFTRKKPRQDEPHIPKPRVPEKQPPVRGISGLELDLAGLAAVRLGETWAAVLNARRAKRRTQAK
ncbi:phosphoesterase [Tumebacillus sp. ITR2]|uniref:Phosphoesterase n=1 Tax=Tumebacillus amylolyticus TaxID=2801339 RepID=A0ABS1JGT6_9BACL|nr:alkaline phosphatase family protein [Tumebacillus amylolyticus]MBL0389489.1 phosphoesterase [Tumebacillus amylolyticus]